MNALTTDSLALMFAVVSAKKERQRDGPFPAARDVIFGTAFAVSDDLFLTAGHVVEAAASVGDVALGRLTAPASDGLFEVAADWEVFHGVDLALIKCPGFSSTIYEMRFDRLPIFSEVQALGFAYGLDPEFHNYAPRGFLGHVVAGVQLLGWRTQPFAYELSFIPPKGLSGAALEPKGFGPFKASGVVVGARAVQIEGSTTRLGIAIAAEELLRLSSRIVGGPLARMFGRDQLPPRALIGTATQRLSDLTPADEGWPD
jgi:hypothetical protein